MKSFKFFQKELKTEYNGMVSIEALRFFHHYYDVGEYQIRTVLATYKLRQMFRRPDGYTTGQVHVTPHDNPRTKIVYYISSNGENPYITGHSILLDNETL